ncbi:helix-turn-helix domain-containing protein [Aequorivita sinensis]|uniref:helix-turn-helix domain-containing protein n=1 Tax=Aequorivita sinensis TaxID=1382458 RepID=UPI00112301CA|nr:helix-turn-helix transcriptional regulator [Aequorivita sinensis]
MEVDTLKTLLATIGKRIEEQRISQDLQPEDVAEMTGLTAATIRNIENGKETYLSTFFAVCLAINMHPKAMLDIEIKLKPLFELSEPRREKSRITPRIDSLLETEFFQIDRTTKDVVEELAAVYKIKTNTPIVSVILNRKVDEGKLKVSKKGRVNFYKKR